MQLTEKQQIRRELAEFCRLKGSQKKASAILAGLSAATVSQLLDGKWEGISDEMWHNIAAQVRDTIPESRIEIRGYKLIYKLLSDAQENALVLGVVGNEGSGKTETIKSYVARNRNVFHLQCADYWNRRFFVSELCRMLGILPSSGALPERMVEIVKTLKKTEHPLLLIDEADKLTDQLLYFFISLYNELEGCCALVAFATPYFETRVLKGVEFNKKGFREIYSRLGRKFIHVPLPNAEDILEICRANGIRDPDLIDEIIADSEFDLRRVARKLYAVKKLLKLKEQRLDDQSN